MIARTAKYMKNHSMVSMVFAVKNNSCPAAHAHAPHQRDASTVVDNMAGGTGKLEEQSKSMDVNNYIR